MLKNFNKEEIAKLLGNAPVQHPLLLQLPDQLQPESITPEAFHQKLGLYYWPFLHFDSLSTLEEVAVQCPWLISHTFWGVENREMGTEYKAKLWAGTVADVTIKWIDNEIGFGVFANQDFAEGAYIGEFTGGVRRLYRSNPEFNAYCFHYPTRFWSKKYYIIDASQGGNETRFINHSDDPNLIPMCLWDRSLLHVVFFAQKRIPKGTQLTYNYGRDFWKHREKLTL
jgi:hypothetical protein